MDSRPIKSSDSEIVKESPQAEVWGDSVFVDDSKQEEFYQHFGQRLRAVREQSQLTQEETARLAGIDRSYLSQIESGKRHISLYVACRLAMVFGQSLAAFLE